MSLASFHVYWYLCCFPKKFILFSFPILWFPYQKSCLGGSFVCCLSKLLRLISHFRMIALQSWYVIQDYLVKPPYRRANWILNANCGSEKVTWASVEWLIPGTQVSIGVLLKLSFPDNTLFHFPSTVSFYLIKNSVFTNKTNWDLTNSAPWGLRFG